METSSNPVLVGISSGAIDKLLRSKEKQREKMVARKEHLERSIKIAKDAHSNTFLQTNTTFKYYLGEEEKLRERQEHVEEFWENKEAALLLERDREVAAINAKRDNEIAAINAKRERELEIIRLKFDSKLDKIGNDRTAATTKQDSYAGYIQKQKEIILSQVAEPNSASYHKMVAELEHLKQEYAKLTTEINQYTEAQDVIHTRERARQVEKEQAEQRAAELQKKMKS